MLIAFVGRLFVSSELNSGNSFDIAENLIDLLAGA